MRSRAYLASLAAVTSLICVWSCGSDDEVASPPVADASLDVATDSPATGDANGGGDAGTDATATDSSTGDAADAADANVLPACQPRVDAGDAGVTVASGFDLETLVSGGPLVDPVGLTFGRDGKLYVANSHSWKTVGSAAGEIMRVEADGGLATFLSDNKLRGPGWVAFTDGGADGGPGLAWLGTEDSDEAMIANNDHIFTWDGVSLTSAFDAAELGRLMVGPGGSFGSDLLGAARVDPSPIAVPNPGRLMRYPFDGGAPAPLPIQQADGGLVGAVQSFAFGNGGALGTDLWVTTVEDPTYTLGASVGLWRVTASFAATNVLSSVALFDIVASPNPAGPWGDFLYATAGDGKLRRISAAGAPTAIVENLGGEGGMTFGPDGALYFTDMARHAIHRLTACQP